MTATLWTCCVEIIQRRRGSVVVFRGYRPEPKFPRSCASHRISKRRVQIQLQKRRTLGRWGEVGDRTLSRSGGTDVPTYINDGRILCEKSGECRRSNTQLRWTVWAMTAWSSVRHVLRPRGLVGLTSRGPRSADEGWPRAASIPAFERTTSRGTGRGAGTLGSNPRPFPLAIELYCKLAWPKQGPRASGR
jgi:hypothetical protein